MTDYDVGSATHKLANALVGDIETDGALKVQEQRLWVPVPLQQLDTLANPSGVAYDAADTKTDVIDVVRLYADIGTDLRQLMFSVTTFPTAASLDVDIGYYELEANCIADRAANVFTNARVTSTTFLTRTSAGFVAASIALANQMFPYAWARIRCVTGTAGTYTAALWLAYITRTGVE